MNRHLTLGLFAVAAALGTACSSSTPVLTDRDTLIVADFANTTGDQIFDDGLKAALQVACSSHPR